VRKVILNLAISLDGFVEGPSGEYDWCYTDQDYGISSFLQQVDAVFCGRKSYELLISVGDEILSGKKKYVFSRNPIDIQDDWTLVNDLRGEVVETILKEKGKNIWLFGGSVLATHLINCNLVHEMILSVHPILLGGGTRLFDKFSERKNLKMIESKEYDSGLVQLTYILKESGS
jgi:dihydrofolate reductase